MLSKLLGKIHACVLRGNSGGEDRSDTLRVIASDYMITHSNTGQYTVDMNHRIQLIRIIGTHCYMITHTANTNHRHGHPADMIWYRFTTVHQIIGMGTSRCEIDQLGATTV